MNEPETGNIPKGDSEDLRQQCAALQRQVTTLLLAVFVLSGTVTVFLWRQARYARADLAVLQPPAAQVIQSFRQEKPIMDDFIAKLTEFSKTHPDFAPILSKYRITPTTSLVATAAPPAMVAPKPAPATIPATAPKK